MMAILLPDLREVSLNVQALLNLVIRNVVRQTSSQDTADLLRLTRVAHLLLEGCSTPRPAVRCVTVLI